VSTALLILIVAIPMVLGVAAWWALLMWGARKDGEFQKLHEPPPGPPLPRG
jgi:hypothetical protein